MTDNTEPQARSALLAEMVSLRNDLTRERWHKRVLVAVLFVVAVLLVLGAREFVRQNETTDKLNDTIARLDATVAELQQQRVATINAVCGSDEALINTFLALQPAPTTVIQQWLEQARLDQFEHEFEQQLAAIGCDLHLDPIKTPQPAQTGNGNVSSGTASGGAAMADGTTTTTTRPTSTTTTTPGAGPPLLFPPTTTQPPTTSVPAPPLTKPNGKPCKGKGKGNPCGV